MKELLQFLLGIALFIFGIFLLLSNINISSIGFYRLGGRVSTGAILIILLIILIICAVVKTNLLTIGLVAADVIAIIVSVIMGTHFYLKSMSAFDLVLMIAIFAAGIGLTLKALFDVNKHS